VRIQPHEIALAILEAHDIPVLTLRFNSADLLAAVCDDFLLAETEISIVNQTHSVFPLERRAKAYLHGGLQVIHEQVHLGGLDPTFALARISSGDAASMVLGCGCGEAEHDSLLLGSTWGLRDSPFEDS
jgi:hypothetical protein